MIHIEEHRAKAPDQDMTTTVVYSVSDTRGPGDVNFRTGHLWRPDNRYPGDWAIRQHEEGGIEMTFAGSQGKERKYVIPPREVDRVILSMLECRGRLRRSHHAPPGAVAEAFGDDGADER